MSAGGQSQQAQYTALEGLKRLGRATAKELTESIGLAYDTTRRALTYLHRDKCILREALGLAGRGRQEFIYWPNPNGPVLLPPTPKRSKKHTQVLVLQVVVDAQGKINSTSVARAMGMTREATQYHLRELCDSGIIKRHRPYHQRSYMYWIEEAQVEDLLNIIAGILGEDPQESILSEEEQAKLWWAPITVATDRAQPNWRMGERFQHGGTTFEQRRQARMGG